MASESPFDLNPSDYAYAPASLDVASTLALGHRLLSVAPVDLPAHAAVNRDLLRSSLTLLGHAYGLMQTEAAAVPRRPVDLRTDTSWSSVKSRLDAWTWQEDGDHRDVLPARELMRKLFPGDSLSFITLDYNAQWAEANWRLELLEREHLLPLLRRLVGDFFVDQLLMWHKRYTAMLGICKEAASPDKPAAKKAKAGQAKNKKPGADAAASHSDDTTDPAESLTVGELRRRAQQAIVGWQMTLVTLHMSGLKGARAALAPTDEFRQRAQSGARTADAPSPSGAAPAPAPAAPQGPVSPAPSPA